MVEKLLLMKRRPQEEGNRQAVHRATLPAVLCSNHSVGSVLFHYERVVQALAQRKHAAGTIACLCDWSKIGKQGTQRLTPCQKQRSLVL